MRRDREIKLALACGGFLQDDEIYFPSTWRRVLFEETRDAADREQAQAEAGVAA